MSDTTDDQVLPTRRRRVPRREARLRLIDATITLLRTLPFDEVGNQAICAEADLNPSTILQHFGTLDNLLGETAKELVRRHVEAAVASGTQPTTFGDPDVELRTRLVAWLILKGIDPDELRSGVVENEAVIDYQTTMLGVGPRTASAWTTLTTLLVEAYSVFAPTHRLAPNQVADVLDLLALMRDGLPDAEQRLGWSEQG
jgi:AcrR family transcriptional regulator